MFRREFWSSLFASVVGCLHLGKVAGFLMPAAQEVDHKGDLEARDGLNPYYGFNPIQHVTQLSPLDRVISWIPATERLPEYKPGELNPSVLAVFNGGQVATCARSQMCDHIALTITHWAELPAPPVVAHAGEFTALKVPSTRKWMTFRFREPCDPVENP